MKKTDLAYVAGIIDGEGCIGIYKHKHRYYLQVAVHMTNEWLVNWLSFAFKGSISTYGYYRKRENCQKEWAWNLTGKKALVFLELVYPYLKLKKPQAEIAIQFQKHKVLPKALTDGQRAIAEAQRILISNLKKEGV